MAKNNSLKVTALPGAHEVSLTREFDAPRELVFKAFTDPEMYAQWLGPRRLKMKLEVFEPHAGGKYRYLHIDQDGTEFGFHGVYHEVNAPDRIINTFEFEGLPEKGHVALDTSIFEALPNNRTKITARSVFQSVEDRDGMIAAGMESGMIESYQRLDELLAKLQK